MNKELRLAIEESVEKSIVSLNLLYCCIATLNNKITNSKNENEYIYSEKRECLSKIALSEFSIDKNELANRIINLSKDCYPTFKAIDRVYRMVNKGYKINDDFIPDKLMKYNINIKTINLANKPKLEKKEYQIQDKDYINICEILESEFKVILTDYSQSELLKLKSYLKCEYSDIFKTLEWNKREIYYSLLRKGIDSSNKKVLYILSCLKNMLPDTQRQIKKQIQRNKEMVEMLDKEFAERSSRPTAEYQRKTKNVNMDKYKDLW